jgi:hypothetical protein
MAKQYSHIADTLQNFIQQQKLFFVGTAASDGRVNISPKGMDSLRVVDQNQVVWLNLTGSGNETSAHVQLSPRMTLMFCAFEGSPMILRLYGNARVIHRLDEQWETLAALFPDYTGSRQLFQLDVDLVQTSCGFGVPFYQYAGEREQLNEWARKKGPQGIEEYWQEKNQLSIDGFPSDIMHKNTRTRG